MGAAVIGYSERGLVNALVTWLRADVDRVRAFLGKGLRWTDTTTAAEVAAIARSVARTTLFVEPGFAQFGDPDLIVVADDARGERLGTFFVEAKVVPYAGAARDNAITRPMGRRGYNSSLNGQLQLRYRLARALACWAPGAAAADLEEPAAVHRAYATGLGDPHRPAAGHHGRRLARGPNLRGLVAHLAGGGNGHPAPDLRRTYFVALTHDDGDPFRRMARRSNDEEDGVGNRAADRPDPCAPWYLPDTGAVSNGGPTPWATAALHTGWSGWTALERVLPGLDVSPDYAAVRPLALAAAPGDGACLCDGGGATGPVRTRRWDVLRDDVVAGAHRVGALLTQEAQKVFGERADLIPRAGSLSVTRDRETVAKVLPIRDDGADVLVVGLAADVSTPLPERFTADRRRINGRSFACTRLPVPPDDGALHRLREETARYFDDLRRAAATVA